MTFEFFNPSRMGTGEVRLAFVGLHLNHSALSAILLVLAVTVFIGVDILLMKAALTKTWSYFAVAMVLSIFANWLYLSVIEQNGLAVGFLITTVLMTLGIALAGVLLFSEGWSHQKSAAVALLLIASGLLIPETQSTGGQ